MAVHRRSRSTRLLVAGLVAASLTTITLDFRGGQEGPLATIGRIGVAIITPLQEAVSTVFRPIGNVFSTIGELGSLREENARLRLEIRKIRGEQVRTLGLERTVTDLKRLLDLRGSLGFEGRTIGANVIAESVSNFEWAITIDRGAEDGVELDTPVIAGEGLVGRVVRVGKAASAVMLIIDPESHVAARISRTGETGLLAGRREEDLRLELIDTDAVVRPGEPVETSGYEGGIFPEGIPIGVVSEVVPSEIDLTKHVMVRPSVDFSALDHVLLILHPSQVGEKGQ